MADAHYTESDLRQAICSLPLRRGDVVYCHSAIGFFGRMENCSNANALSSIIFDCIVDVIGSVGTLLVPTYTYSFPQGLDYDSLSDASEMGVFAEWVRTHPQSYRSDDPCFSVAAIGNDAEALVGNVGENSFGANSVFERFFESEGKVLCMNFSGCTFIHYVERRFKVPYRFDKTFDGYFVKDGNRVRGRSTIFVRDLERSEYEDSPVQFERLGRLRGYTSVQKLGRGELTVINAQSIYNLINKTLLHHPLFLTKAGLFVDEGT
ncbi:AAC(3) family N-acetyltransferase [Gammaproteobacteria bacterium]|nr:AAC(3) family N-acetyltransferase [Gammaproteobacteria bacterium]